MKYIDFHVHLYEFDESEIKKYKDFILICVAEDLPTSNTCIYLSKKFDNVIPSVGIHPWNIEECNENSIKQIENLIEEFNISIFGEIGLDKKFVPNTFNKQVKCFEKFLKLAKDYNLILNLHAPDAWRDVFNLLLKYKIEKAYFHWYTGPLDLLKEIQESGYFIGINPAIKIQEKHKKVLENADLNYILTESDGRYNYKGLTLEPSLIKETIKIISKIKGLGENNVKDQILENFKRIYG